MYPSAIEVSPVATAAMSTTNSIFFKTSESHTFIQQHFQLTDYLYQGSEGYLTSNRESVTKAAKLLLYMTLGSLIPNRSIVRVAHMATLVCYPKFLR
jgi:hypothetical protein